jgi:hypothetical protein
MFCLATAPTGLFLWHGNGKHFGFGPNSSIIDAKTAILSLLTTILIITIESLAALI